MKSRWFPVCFCLFFHSVVLAEDVRIVSHYPVSAYITERLLPFSVVGGQTDREIHIQSVHLAKGMSCQSIIDPFHERVFHVYCERPTRVRVDVRINDTVNGTFKISTDEFQVRWKNEPASSSGGSGGDL